MIRRQQTDRPFNLLIAGMAAVLLAAHVLYYYPFFSDDSLISLRYAQRLLDGHGLTWTDGRPVEGYSNLLWILSSAFLGLFGVDLITAARILGALGAAAVVAAIWRRCDGGDSTPASALAAFAIGTAVWVLSAPVAIWTLAGLEAPMFAAFLAWGLVTLLREGVNKPAGPRDYVVPGVWFGLMCLTRPDGPLLCAAAAVWIAVSGRLKKRALVSAGAFLAAPVILVLGQLMFRLSYYGEWLPNVAYVKVSPSVSHIAGGLRYVGRGFWALMPVSGIAVAGLIAMVSRGGRWRRPASLLLALMVVWLGYVAFIGGDIFSGWRHFVPFVVMMVFSAVIISEWALLHKRRPKKLWLPVGVALAGWFVAGQFLNPSNRFTRQDTWVWNCEVVGRALKGGFSDVQPLLAVTAAGGIPYWSELPCIDMLGLNDYTIARTPLPDTGAEWIG
ncbi:MAG: hypothetical protein PVF33_09545, partial [Candidatus Latescibacterota bacterium]